MYFLLVLIITYLLYRFLIRRLRWRALRFGVGIPLMVIFVLGFSIVWGVITADARTQDPAETIDVLDEAVVQQGDLQVTISSTGQIQPNRQVALAFAASGLVTNVYVEEGQTVEAGDLIASLDTADLDRLIDQATIALDLQQAVYDALTRPPSEFDIAVAQAALDAARASYNAAASTGPSVYQEEIARLQTEIARNRLWQAQLSRDSITVPEPLSGIDVSTGNDTVDGVIDDINATISAQSSAQIAAAQAQLRQAESSLEQLDYGVAIADANYESTVSRGADIGSVSSALAGITQAEIALENLLNGPDELQLEMANIDLETSQYAIELAEYNRSQSELHAPFAGVIVQNNFVVGQTPPQGIGAILIDDSVFYVELPVDEVDIVNVQVGQRVTLRVDALPDQDLGGEVVRVAYTPTRLGQLVVYNVRVRVDETAALIRAGMSVTGDIIVQDKSDVVYVPNRFVRIDRITLDAFVTVQNTDGTYQERLVLLGARNDTDSEILAGLQAGEQIVLLPQQANTTATGLLRSGAN